ncbi:MAG TPA: prefoldin subunit alpha [Thermoplasmatales archaeon]|nr:prefoldin subunit alpha [Thermoplasmatales archaeon]
MTEQENVAEYMALLEAYKEQLESLEQQSTYLQALINEYTKARITIEELSKRENNAEILVPIGGGAFVPATSKDTSKVILAEGAEVFIERSAEEAVEALNKRIEDLQNSLGKLDDMAQQIQERAQEVSNTLQNMLKGNK